jgi:hypothetical protein
MMAKHRPLNFLLIVSFIYAGFFSSSSFSKVLDQSRWLAFGDIRGYFEPCGCDPATDLGGMTRLERYIRLERLLHPDLLVFNLGNALSPLANSTALEKNKAIASSLSAILPDVSLFNKTELLTTSEIAKNISYVLSNHKNLASLQLNPTSKKGTANIQSSVTAGNFVVFGYVEPFRGYDKLSKFSKKDWLSIVNATLALNKKKIPFLLYSGSKKGLQDVADLGIFAQIISSNRHPMTQEFADEERRDESLLLALKTRENLIYSTPLGGQGVLRSSSLQDTAPAVPLDRTLATPPTPTSKPCTDIFNCKGVAKAPSFYNRSLVTWLERQYSGGESEDMLKIVSGFRSAQEESMKRLTAAKLGALKNSKFVGSEKCTSCHSTSHTVWAKSKHSTAFATLEKISRTSDPECVSCHVVGFSEDGGFISAQETPHLANVQCESCHGPSKDHLENISEKPKGNASKSCKTCHTPPHSPKYDPKKYWDKIKH